MNRPGSAEILVADPDSLRTSELLLAVALAGLSGLAVLGQAFGWLTMAFSVPLFVLPGGLLLCGLMLMQRRLYGRLRTASNLLIRGAVWGLAGTIVYDITRPLIVRLLAQSFDPYRAMPVFGSLMTGLPVTDPVAITLGWLYHFWNGVSFGMIFALVRPRGGIISGFLWGETLQILMMVAYPSLLGLHLDDPGFLASSLIGHGLWGIVLGWGLRREKLLA